MKYLSMYYNCLAVTNSSKKVIFSAMLLLYSLTIQAQTWTGDQSTDWNNANNWQPKSIPSLNDKVFIPSSASNWPTVSSTVNIRVLNMEPSSHLNLLAGSSLTMIEFYCGGGFINGVDNPLFAYEEGGINGINISGHLTIHKTDDDPDNWQNVIASGTITFIDEEGNLQLAVGGTNTFSGRTIIQTGATPTDPTFIAASPNLSSTISSSATFEDLTIIKNGNRDVFFGSRNTGAITIAGNIIVNNTNTDKDYEIFVGYDDNGNHGDITWSGNSFQTAIDYKGNLKVGGFTQSNTNGTVNLILNPIGNSADLFFTDTEIKGQINLNVWKLNLYDTEWKGEVDANIYGSNTSVWEGGNTFDENVTITADRGNIHSGVTEPDIFNKDLTIKTTQSSQSGKDIHLAHSSQGNIFGGKLILETSMKSASVTVAHSNGSTANITGLLQIDKIGANQYNAGIKIGGSTGGTVTLSSPVVVDQNSWTRGMLTFEHVIQQATSGITLNAKVRAGVPHPGGLALKDCDWSGNIEADVDWANFEENTFRGTLEVKTRGEKRASQWGDNIFKQSLSLNILKGPFTAGYNQPDVYEGAVTVVADGSKPIKLAYNTIGNLFQQGLSITTTTTGKDGYVSVAENGAANITGILTVAGNHRETRILLGDPVEPITGNHKISFDEIGHSNFTRGVLQINNLDYSSTNDVTWVFGEELKFINTLTEWNLDPGKKLTIEAFEVNLQNNKVLNEVFVKQTNGSKAFWYDNIFQEDVSIEAVGGGMSIGYGSQDVFERNLYFTTKKNTSGNNTHSQLGSSGGSIRVGGSTHITRELSYQNIAIASDGGAYFNGDIILSSLVGNGGIFFGQGNGFVEIDGGQVIVSDFKNSKIHFENVAELTNLGINISSSFSNADEVIFSSGCHFKSNIVVNASKIEFNGSSFGGTVVVTQNSKVSSISQGGNIFNGDFTFNIGDPIKDGGSVTMQTINTDVFKGKATFNLMNRYAAIHLGHGHIAEFEHELHIKSDFNTFIFLNLSGQVSLGIPSQNSAGGIAMNGTGNQSLIVPSFYWPTTLSRLSIGQGADLQLQGQLIITEAMGTFAEFHMEDNSSLSYATASSTLEVPGKEYFSGRDMNLISAPSPIKINTIAPGSTFTWPFTDGSGNNKAITIKNPLGVTTPIFLDKADLIYEIGTVVQKNKGDFVGDVADCEQWKIVNLSSTSGANFEWQIHNNVYSCKNSSYKPVAAPLNNLPNTSGTLVPQECLTL